MMNAPGKIMVLGLAGLDWSGLAARISAGRLPAIAAVIARGTAGPMLAAGETIGPVAWATIATGLSPEGHGIILDQELWAGGLRPVGHASWTADPIWRRLADAGFATASVGWPATAPGAAWAGTHVDPRFAAAAGRCPDDWLMPPGVAPDGWAEKLRDLRIHPTDIKGAMLLPFVPDLLTVDQDRDPSLVDLALMIARLSSDHAAAMTLIQAGEWDVLVVHHGWLGEMQARFANAPPPYEGVVDAAWTLLDQLVGATVAALPAGATILLVAPGPPGHAGLLAAAGPGIAQGRRLRGATPYDVAPSLLAHFGLSDPALPGRTLFGGPETLRPAAPMRTAAAAVEPDRADLARVAAFGHVPPQAPPQWRARTLSAKAEMLLSRDPAAAARFAEAALAIDPNALNALGARAAAHAALEESDPLPAVADRIAAASPGHLWEALVRAGYHALRGEVRLAAPYLKRIEAEAGPEELLRAGAAWMMLKRPLDAARLFDAVRARQPDNVAALLGLAMAKMRRPIEAEPWLRRVLELDPGHTVARDALAAMLRDTGRAREADMLLQG